MFLRGQCSRSWSRFRLVRESERSYHFHFQTKLNSVKNKLRHCWHILIQRFFFLLSKELRNRKYKNIILLLESFNLCTLSIVPSFKQKLKLNVSGNGQVAVFRKQIQETSTWLGPSGNGQVAVLRQQIQETSTWLGPSGNGQVAV